MFLTNRIRVQLIIRIPNGIHAPVIPLTPGLAYDLVIPHLTDDPTGRRKVFDLFHLGTGFWCVFEFPELVSGGAKGC